MKTKKGFAWLLSIAMIFSVCTGLMMTTANAAAGDLASVKLEVYEATDKGDFGRKLNFEGANPDTLKVGKEIIIAVQLYNGDKILGTKGLAATQFQVTYDSTYLQQTMVKSGGSFVQESNFAGGVQNIAQTDFWKLAYIKNQSNLWSPNEEAPTIKDFDPSKNVSEDAAEYDKELMWMYKSAYSPAFQIKKKGATTEYEIIAAIQSANFGDLYNPTMMPRAGEDNSYKKMMAAYKFKVLNIPEVNDGKITVDFNTADSSFFKIDRWNASAVTGNATADQLGYSALTGTDGLSTAVMNPVVPLEAEITDPSDAPVIDTEHWDQAVVKNLTDEDLFGENSVIHVTGTKSADTGEVTKDNVPAGLKFKLYDKENNTLKFGATNEVASLEEFVSPATDVADFEIDLTTVRNADGTPIKDQNLFLVAQQDPKGDSEAVKIVENSPAPVITAENAKKVVDFTTGKLLTNSDVTITKVKKAIDGVGVERDLVVGSEVKVYSAKTGTTALSVQTAALNDVTGKAEVTFNLDTLDNAGFVDADLYFTVKEPNDFSDVPANKAESLRTLLPEASGQPIIKNVVKEEGKIKAFDVTGLKKTSGQATATIIDENVEFALISEGSPDPIPTTDYVVTNASEGKKFTLNTAVTPKLEVVATQTIDEQTLLPSNPVEVELKLGAPVIANIVKNVDTNGMIMAGSEVTVSQLLGDGDITDANIRLILYKEDGTTVVENAGSAAENGGVYTWTIKLPEATADQTFQIIAHHTSNGSMKDSDPTFVAKNSLRPAEISITNNYNVDPEKSTYDILVKSLEGGKPIGEKDVLNVYLKDGTTTVATIPASDANETAPAEADATNKTYQFKQSIPGATLGLTEQGVALELEVIQKDGELTLMKSLKVDQAPVVATIFVNHVVIVDDPNTIPDAIANEKINDVATRTPEQLEALKADFFKSRVAIPEGTAISKADLGGFTLNDKVVVEFNTEVTLEADGIKSKYHAIPISWTQDAPGEATRTKIADTTGVDTPKATIGVSGGLVEEQDLYGLVYDFKVLSAADQAKLTTVETENEKPNVKLVVKKVPKIVLADGNRKVAVEKTETTEENKTDLYMYVRCFYRDPGFDVKLGADSMGNAKIGEVTRQAYKGEQAIGDPMPAYNPNPGVGVEQEKLRTFLLRNEAAEKTVVDENSPTGFRNMGDWKIGDYTVKYVYRYTDESENDKITVKGATGGNEHSIDITAERKVIIRYMRGDVMLDGKVDISDITPLAQNTLRLDDPILTDSRYFDGYLRYVADTTKDIEAGREFKVDISDITPLSQHILNWDYQQDYTDYVFVEDSELNS